jgi:hypothetical protein
MGQLIAKLQFASATQSQLCILPRYECSRWQPVFKKPAFLGQIIFTLIWHISCQSTILAETTG